MMISLEIIVLGDFMSKKYLINDMIKDKEGNDDGLNNHLMNEQQNMIVYRN